jgi:hypothetical protein
MKKEPAPATKQLTTRIPSKTLIAAMLKSATELEQFAKANHGEKSFERGVATLLSAIVLYLERRYFKK